MAIRYDKIIHVLIADTASPLSCCGGKGAVRKKEYRGNQDGENIEKLYSV